MLPALPRWLDCLLHSIVCLSYVPACVGWGPEPLRAKPFTTTGGWGMEPSQLAAALKRSASPTLAVSLPKKRVVSSQALAQRDARPARAPAAPKELPLHRARPEARLPSDAGRHSTGPGGVVKPTAPSAGGRVMRGRLRARSSFWFSVVTCSLVLSWVTGGFPLRWAQGRGPPAPRVARNHKTALDHSTFVDAAVADLLATSAAVEWEVPPDGFVACPLGVVPKKGEESFRLVWDGRYVNKELLSPTFTYETLAFLPDVLRSGDYLFTVDLKAGYHHLDVRPEDWKYLGFTWRGRYYSFTQLPFGLSPACWAFSALTRSVLKHFRLRGIRCTGYIDDSLYGAADSALLAAQQAYVLQVWDQLGFYVNFPKSQLVISPRVTYLGMVVDAGRGVMIVPDDKKRKLIDLISTLVRDRRGTRRDLAVVKGKLLSMAWAFGTVARFYARELDGHMGIDYLAPWDAGVSFTDSLLRELEFWLECFDRFNGRRRLWPPVLVDYVLRTDAAGRSDAAEGGWGAIVDVPGRGQVRAHGVWSAGEADESSTWRELTAVLRALQSFTSSGAGTLSLAGSAVRVVTDSLNTYLAIERGSAKSPPCVTVLKENFWLCVERDITLSATWIPREDNAEADALSKWVDSDDVMLNPDVFSCIADRFGPLTVDVFASPDSAQLPVFFSRLHTVGAAGVDALALPWPDGSWINPPYALLSRVVRRCLLQTFSGVLLVPVWPSAPWWFFLLNAADRSLFCARVVGCMYFAPRDGFLLNVARGVRCPVPAKSYGFLALQLGPQHMSRGAVRVPDAVVV